MLTLWNEETEVWFKTKFERPLRNASKKISAPNILRNKRPTVIGFTIDSITSRDLDDGISVSKLPDGRYELIVSIADVASIIKKWSTLDKEALERATSVYFWSHNFPMFPRKISGWICSLNWGKMTQTQSTSMIFSPEWELLEIEIFESNFFNKNRLGYETIGKHFLDKNSDIHDDLVIAAELKEILHKRRTQQYWDSNFTERVSLYLWDVNERPKFSENFFWNLSRDIIHEFMLAANIEKTKLAVSNGINQIYRVHMPETSFSENISEMERAVYSILQWHHYWLKEDIYGQHTSPIRRFWDLFNQRNEKAYVLWEESPYSLDESQDTCWKVQEVTSWLLEQQRRYIQAGKDERNKRKLKRFFNFKIWKSDLEASDFEEYIFKISDFSTLPSYEIDLISDKLNSSENSRELLIFIFVNSNNYTLITEVIKQIDFGIDLWRIISLCKTLSFEYDFNIDFLEQDWVYYSKSFIFKRWKKVFEHYYDNVIEEEYKDKWIKSMQHRIHRKVIEEFKNEILKSSRISIT